MTEKIPVLVLFGPTASGKTKLAVEICKELNGEVVTADSMQVYKKMNIGTAKPSDEELNEAPHHLFDFADPFQSFSLNHEFQIIEGGSAEYLQKNHLFDSVGLWLKSGS